MSPQDTGRTDGVECSTSDADAALDRLSRMVSAELTSPPVWKHALDEIRAVSGAAVMPRRHPITECVLASEQLIDALAAGRVVWSAPIRKELVAVLDDLRVFVRTIRAWTPDLDRRALERRDSVLALVSEHRPTGPLPPEAARGVALHALLDRTLAGFSALRAEPLSPPVALADELVPIDDLLYRGPSALRRATELRDQIRAAGRPPAAEELDELFALIDLARAS